MPRRRSTGWFLELATPQAGELDVLADLPRTAQLGAGVVNQKLERVERRDRGAGAERDRRLRGRPRAADLDRGFETFAHNPVTGAAVAEAKFGALVSAALVRRG